MRGRLLGERSGYSRAMPSEQLAGRCWATRSKDTGPQCEITTAGDVVPEAILYEKNAQHHCIRYAVKVQCWLTRCVDSL